MDDFHNLSCQIDDIQQEILDTKLEISNLEKLSNENTNKLHELNERIKSLYKISGLDDSNLDSTVEVIQQINTDIDSALFSMGSKTESDRTLDINKVDLLVSCLAGGLAILVDFILVKVPKDMNIRLNGQQVHHEGSPLTALIRKIGITKDGKEANWIKSLEKSFHVNYDPSIKGNIPGMYFRNHRVFSLGHDPSILGLIWGVKDIVNGTFSYIDRNGILCIDKVQLADYTKLLYAPILWLGHIISDLFTRQGIPIPGTCLLRMFQAGSFGDKNRTLSQLVTYMYDRLGYDLRHLATMSTCKLVIDFVLKTYTYLIIPKENDPNLPLYEKDYIRVKNEQKKEKMSFIAYSVATAGNISKVAAYEGNPSAINATIWYEFIRGAITQAVIYFDDGKDAMSAIENRHLIDETFEQLVQQSKS